MTVYLKPNILNYNIIEKLGEGSYGIVYKVQNPETKEFFAIK